MFSMLLLKWKLEEKKQRMTRSTESLPQTALLDLSSTR